MKNPFIYFFLFIFSVFGCKSDKTRQNGYRISNDLKIKFIDELDLQVYSLNFWNTETAILQLDKYGYFYGYDFYAKKLYKFDSRGQFIKTFMYKRDSLGRSYNRLTDFIIDKSGNIVLYDNSTGNGVVLDSVNGDIVQFFQSESTRWFYIAQAESGYYLFCNSTQTSSLPILYAYNQLGELLWSSGKSEPELLTRNNPLLVFSKCVAIDTADNIFTVHPALYKIQCYNSDGEKLFTFSVSTNRWHQMPHQPVEQDSINWSGQISTIQHLGTTSQFLLVFIANFINGNLFEQWIDVYDFAGNYLSSLELPSDKRPVFVEKNGYIWFIDRKKTASKSIENRAIEVECWQLHFEK